MLNIFNGGGGLLTKILFNRITFNLYKKLNIPVQIKNEQRHEEWLVVEKIPHSMRTPLTEKEKQEVVDFWGICPASFVEYEIYKYFRGFDVRFMPMSIYLPLITRRINDYQYTEIMEHKSLFGYLTNGVVHFPHCYFRTVHGEYYASNMEQLSFDQAIAACLDADRFVIKDSLGGSGGKGIEILKLEGKTSVEKADIIKRSVAQRKTDYVVQEFLYEHDLLKQFNQTSVNTIRVQSLYLNGKFSAVTIILRFGGEGAEVDNACSGGVAVGIHPDGTLFEYGYDNQANQYDRKGNIIFKETKLPFIPDLIKHVEEAHKHQFPLCKYIGWDMIIDRNGKPVCIEINSCQNGHLTFQLSAGPTFGERTQEVIDYCKTKKLYFNKALFKY